MTVEARARLGVRIRQARVEAKLSQTQLADRIGAHFTSVSDWERGKNAPSSRHLMSVARETDKPLAFFADDDEEEAASMGLTRFQLDVLATLAVALEPYRKREATA